MFVALDDTDSREGMCTTFLLTEIIRRSKLDVIGFPQLVRLNPAIEYKTRGNGALVVNLAKGKGTQTVIGNFDGREIRSYAEVSEEPSVDELIGLSRDAVMEFSELEDPDTNPGIVISRSRFPQGLYWESVQGEVSIDHAENFVIENGGIFIKVKSGRGIIGAAAAISWPMLSTTYELLVYRYPKPERIEASLKESIARWCDTIPGTFNNFDPHNRYAAIFPKERTPVVFGVRGVEYEPILEAVPEMLKSSPIAHERYLIFSTNQGSDDHIIHNSEKFMENCSYEVTGYVEGIPRIIEGSHYFIRFRTKSGSIDLAAFEPTKEFRELFRNLKPNDELRVFGTYRKGTLNVEKMEVISVSQIFVRSSPVCGSCGNVMESRGHMDYRCRNCREKETLPRYRLKERSLIPGKYDVPIIARRHISRPYELENIARKARTLNRVTL
ncbi:MAG: tRNA(Ile)(2)-agmatinylcytidine synthase [Candidatus Thermoplasmatota archaeon]|nr:tRNA(Ile)(2)-agmatinylcytidine synthase [Candidatus Thermoplasmatota archaeon]